MILLMDMIFDGVIMAIRRIRYITVQKTAEKMTGK